MSDYQWDEWQEACDVKYGKERQSGDLMWLGVPCPQCGAPANNWCSGESKAPGCVGRKEFWLALGSPRLWDVERLDMSLQLAMWKAARNA